MRRQWAGAEAAALGWGGLTAVSKATGLALNTIMAGRSELPRGKGRARKAAGVGIRRPGGGRKPLTRTHPELRPLLLRLVDPATRGHPESSLLWSSKSTRKLATELTRQGRSLRRL